MHDVSHRSVLFVSTGKKCEWKSRAADGGGWKAMSFVLGTWCFELCSVHLEVRKVRSTKYTNRMKASRRRTERGSKHQVPGTSLNIKSHFHFACDWRKARIIIS